MHVGLMCIQGTPTMPCKSAVWLITQSLFSLLSSFLSLLRSYQYLSELDRIQLVASETCPFSCRRIEEVLCQWPPTFQSVGKKTTSTRKMVVRRSRHVKVHFIEWLPSLITELQLQLHSGLISEAVCGRVLSGSTPTSFVQNRKIQRDAFCTMAHERGVATTPRNAVSWKALGITFHQRKQKEIKYLIIDESTH